LLAESRDDQAVVHGVVVCKQDNVFQGVLLACNEHLEELEHRGSLSSICDLKKYCEGVTANRGYNRFTVAASFLHGQGNGVVCARPSFVSVDPTMHTRFIEPPTDLFFLVHSDQVVTIVPLLFSDLVSLLHLLHIAEVHLSELDAVPPINGTQRVSADADAALPEVHDPVSHRHVYLPG
jgi:hypothetical protein